MARVHDTKMLLVLLCVAAMVAVAPTSLHALSAKSVAAPQDAQWVTWQAEEAAQTGPWRMVNDPSASGGSYLESDGPEGALEFSFHLDKPTAVQLRPIWWRTGERKPSRRFPYPFERQPGPDALARCGQLVAFTAPTAGRVGFVDATTGAVAGYVQVGGYLSDLVAEESGETIYVADASGGRVVVVDVPTRKVVASIATPPQPWSLALGSWKLYVACRSGRCVAIIDTRSRIVVRTVALPAAPVSLQVPDKSPREAVIRFQQQVFDVRDLKETEPDRAQYGLGLWHRSAQWKNQKTFDSPASGVLRVTVKGKASQIDTRGVAAKPDAAELPATFSDTSPGFSAMAFSGDRLFFTSPGNGRVGVVNAATEKLVKTIDVGGWPVDIVVDAKRNKAYVADAQQARLVVIDTAKMAVAKIVKVPTGPCSLELVSTYSIQRDYMVPPTEVNKLFVACRGTGQMAVVDVTTDRVTKTIGLPATPRRVGFVSMPNPDWWPLLAADRIALSLTPRVAVEAAPVRLDLDTLAVSSAPKAPEAAPSHSTVGPETGGTPAFRAANDLLLTRPKSRAVDVSAIADPQLMDDRPLGSGDVPGSIAYSVDGGPEADWSRNVWIRPDNNVMLVAGSEEYWRWNAPRMTLGPGDHTVAVRARGDYVCLDALQIARTAEPLLSMAVLPEPRSLHAEVPSSSYQGVFYDQEPVRFSVVVTSRTSKTVPVRIESHLTNYMDEEVAATSPLEMTALPGQPSKAMLDLHPKDTGHFTLTLTLRSPDGDVVRDVRFVRVPKLEHPRLFFRKSDLPAIEKRIAEHPKLFQRYAAWLNRRSRQEGRYPQRFLPPGITQVDASSAAPVGTEHADMQYGWRMYELGFRMLAMEFAARFVPGSSETLQKRMQPLLEKPRTDSWVEYHHHGPFFPGAVEGMVDMAPDEMRADLPLTRFFAASKGSMNVYPWTLMVLEEPISPKDRALIYKIATMHTNFERYFETHEGTRGGTWWQNPWSWCYCPTQGIFLSFLFTSNFLGEERLFSKGFFRGYLTYMGYVDPISDRRQILPALRRPSGEPWRWILSAISRHPVEKDKYSWEEWVRKLDGDLPQPEDKAVDDLFALKGMPLSGPLEAAPHRFNTGVSIPVALALGWYDPKAPTVTKSEMPTTALFDVDGLATMRSSWRHDATEVEFWCGARDHTARHEPGHFTVIKGGEFLLGTPANWADDGNCTPAWGNTVVFGDAWLRRWQLNLDHPRAEEYSLIDRFSPPTWTYISRERQLNGYSPAEGGWGGGIDLHGHTESLFVGEGKILAYETSPEFDYVAGDATNAWPVDEARQHVRQLVYLKPNVVVVYDRVILGPGVRTSRWIAATGPKLKIDGSAFSVKAGKESLSGEVVLPREAILSAPKPLPDYQWKGQQMLEVRPPAQAREMDYLVVLSVGEGKAVATDVWATEQPGLVDLALKVDGNPVTLRFSRSGPIGGTISYDSGGRRFRRDLARTIDDTYARWASDPRYVGWTEDPKFDFVIPARDRKYRQR